MYLKESLKSNQSFNKAIYDFSLCILMLHGFYKNVICLFKQRNAYIMQNGIENSKMGKKFLGLKEYIKK